MKILYKLTAWYPDEGEDSLVHPPHLEVLHAAIIGHLTPRCHPGNGAVTNVQYTLYINVQYCRLGYCTLIGFFAKLSSKIELFELFPECNAIY